MHFNIVTAIAKAVKSIRANTVRTDEQSEHQSLRMPTEQQGRSLSKLGRMPRIAIFSGGFMAIVICIQLVYPTSKMVLPNTYILDQRITASLQGAAAEQINKLISDKRVQLAVDQNRTDVAVVDIGLKADEKLVFSRSIHYPWYKRLVPFSLLTKRSINSIAVTVEDEDKLQTFTKSLKASYVEPQDATVKINGNKVAVVPAKIGRLYEDGTIADTLRSAVIDADGAIVIRGKEIEPDVSTDVAQKVADAVESRLNTPLALKIDGKNTNLNADAMASMIKIQKEGKKLVFGYDAEAIRAYIKPHADTLYVPGVPVKQVIVDGGMTQNTPGAPGTILPLEKSGKALQEALAQGATEVRIASERFTPEPTVTRHYNATSKGLQALIDWWVKQNQGEHSISVTDIDGGIVAGYNQSKTVYPASVYKMYLADVLFHKVAASAIAMDSIVLPGLTAEMCLDRMIVASDNPCAYAIGDALGWQDNDGFLQQQGFTGTSLVNSNLYTTAQDSAQFMRKLQNGNLIDGDSRNKLLSMMGRQIYRGGIPAGSSGHVANKVGHYGTYVNDAGIVYGPKRTYALAVMSKGSSYANIADLSRYIATAMAQ